LGTENVDRSFDAHATFDQRKELQSKEGTTSVTAYVISDAGAVAPEDEAAWKAYLAAAPASIAKYGGRYLARGGAIDVMEGDWSPHAIVVVEFPDREAAARWYASPEYAECLKIRGASGLTRRLICIDGATDASPDDLLGLTRAGSNRT
jgi:uncharacterized protein (DUF1330 family)